MLGQMGCDAVLRLQQFGKAQHDERHHVVAVQVRIEDQVGLVAQAGQQGTALADDGRRGGRRHQGRHELLVELAAAHAFAVLELLRAQPLHMLRPAQARWCVRPEPGPIDQGVTQGTDVGVARDLLAGEVDEEELLVDQDAGHIDDCTQIQQVDQQQLAPHAQPGQQASERVSGCIRHSGWFSKAHAASRSAVCSFR
jgi:hypothetical protein